MFFVCAKCKIQITRNVRGLADQGMVSTISKQDYLPQGSFLFHPKDWQKGGQSAEFILNLKDMLNTKHHPDESRLNGCCGNDGLDGLNTVCANGHEIGTECSDCWTPHYMQIDPSKVLQINDSQPNPPFNSDPTGTI